MTENPDDYRKGYEMTTATSQEVLDHIAISPAGKRAAAEIAVGRLERRKDLVGELALLEAQESELMPKLNAACEKTATVVQADIKRLQASQAKHGEAAAARSGASSASSAARGKVESQLIETASPAIMSFWREMETLADEVRRGVRGVEGGRHWLTRRRGEPTTNYGTVRATLEAITAARLDADALKLEPLTDADVEKRLEAMRATILSAWGDGN